MQVNGLTILFDAPALDRSCADDPDADRRLLLWHQVGAGVGRGGRSEFREPGIVCAEHLVAHAKRRLQHHSGSLGQCTLGQCPLIQLWRPPACSTFGPGPFAAHALGEEIMFTTLRSTATTASHQSPPEFSARLLARSPKQSLTPPGLSWRVSLNVQWISSCANASHPNWRGSKHRPTSVGYGRPTHSSLQYRSTSRCGRTHGGAGRAGAEALI